MPVSIRDIASRAGVAPSTVSRVITGSARYRISEATAQRVWQAVRELDYRVDHVARHMVRRRWHTDKPRGGIYRLAVAHPGLDNELAAPFYYDILFGVQAQILDQRLALAGIYESKMLRDERTLFHATDPVEVDGVLVLSEGPDAQLLRRRVKAVVVLNAPPTPDTDTVAFDYRVAIGHMVRHLAGLGHRHIAYVGRHPSEQAAFASSERTEGFIQTMRELGLALPPGNILTTVDARRTRFEAQARRFLALKPRPTALVCASDRVCIEMLRRLAEAGLRVPQDVAIGGYEDLEVASYMIPRLTTVNAPRQEMGREGVRLLVRRLDDPAAEIAHRVLATRLVVRESCGSGSKAV